MSTPNMSGRSDAPERTPETHLSPGDLLNDDGTIDIGKVKGVTNSGGGEQVWVSPSLCAKVRERLLDAQSAREAASEFRFGSSCLRNHAKGDCHHDEGRVPHPPCEWVAGEGWVVANE